MEEEITLDIYEAIKLRRTVRDFKDEKIEITMIKKILNAGLLAPTNDHMRSWNFVIMNDPAAKLELIKLVVKDRTEKQAITTLDNWGLVDRSQREMYIDAIPKQYKMLLNCGCLIVPCFQQTEPLLEPSKLSSLNGFASIWCCIENILLSAVAEGIYGVTRIPGDDELTHIKTILNIPDDYEVPCYLALGYPAENLKELRQNFVNVEERMHFNQW